MTVYFDLLSFDTLLKSYKDVSNGGEDILRMLKRQMNVHLNFDPNELDEDAQLILGFFTQGIVEECEFTSGLDKVSRPVEQASVVSNSDVFLLNSEQHPSACHNYYIGSNDDVFDVLSKLLIDQTDYGFHRQPMISSDPNLNFWNHLVEFQHPFSTVLIIDRYCFKSSNFDLFEFNLGLALAELYTDKKAKTRVVIIGEIEFDNHNGVRIERPIDKSAVFSKIRSAVGKNCHKHCPSPEIVLVLTKSRIDQEHDRNIVTNYLRFKSGDSFVYYDSLGRIITKSSDADLYSLAKREYRQNTKQLVAKMERLIQGVEEEIKLKSAGSGQIHTSFNLKGPILNF